MIRALLLLFLCPLVATAQPTGKLAGRVVDGHGNPLPGANVTIESLWHSTLTDVDGRYLLGAPAGRYAVAASHIAHESRTDTVTIRPEFTTRRDMVLPLLPGCTPDSSYRTENSSWQEAWLPPTRSITKAYGLPSLDGQTSGPREARFWALSLTDFGPWNMIRLVWNAEDVVGSVLLGWPFRNILGDSARWASRCGPFRREDSAEACEPVLTEEPDWSSVASDLEGAGFWTLPDETTLPDLYAPCGFSPIGEDGTTYIVELFDGASYRAYHYWSPDAHSPWPEERQARRLVGILHDVLDLIPQPEH